MTSKRQLEDDMFNLRLEQNRIDARLNHTQTALKAQYELNGLHIAQMDAIMGYLGIKVQQIDKPASTEYKVVKIKKEKK